MRTKRKTKSKTAVTKLAARRGTAVTAEAASREKQDYMSKSHSGGIFEQCFYAGEDGSNNRPARSEQQQLH